MSWKYGYQGMFAQIASITDSLFLSGAHPIQLGRLRAKGITLVINVSLEVPEIHSMDIKSYRLLIGDSPQCNLGVHFNKIADLIHKEAKHGGKTLVHCVAGVSRSASLCIAYMMKHHSMSLRKAYFHVKAQRSVIRPNVGFFRQLLVFEKHLFKKCSVKMVNSSYGVVPEVYLT